jgi:hypothetical protein
MKVLTGPQPPLQPAQDAKSLRVHAALMGAALVVFALAALTVALMLEGPAPADAPAAATAVPGAGDAATAPKP